MTTSAEPMVMKSHRFPAALYEAAIQKARARRERLSDVLRDALDAYVKGDQK